MLDLSKVTKVTLSDYSQYKERTCRNGGDYAFFTKYIRMSENEWRVEYSTTSDFAYCPVCGSFNDHTEYDESGDVSYSCGDFTVITTDELEEIIKDAPDDANHDIDYGTTR